MLFIITLCPFIALGQNVVDQCFFSVAAGNDFGGSGDISNSGCDLALYGADGWQGSSFGVF